MAASRNLRTKEPEKNAKSIISLGGVTCHSWNGDGTSIAFSPNNSEIFIYSTEGEQEDPSKWKKTHTLKGHTGFVSGIDWSAVNGLIVTCGHDRNAYVWKPDDNGEWTPTLVILRINRGATAVRWSPAGDKFAVTSGSKCVPVCHFEQSNNWWISKMIKKHKSTVLCLDWCPNNKFIVTGATDFKCRVLSAYIAGIDSEEDDGFGDVWKKQHTFGEVLAEFDQAKAWVNCVAWSPNGFRVAFGGHGATIHFAQILAGQKPAVTTIDLEGLPFLDMAFMSDNVVIAGGFDRTPISFVATGEDQAPNWALCEVMDKKEEKKKEVKKGGAFANSRALFAASADQGKSFGSKKGADTKIWTQHKNSIMSIRKLNEVDGKTCSLISTAGIDGRILFWNLENSAEKAVYGL